MGSNEFYSLNISFWVLQVVAMSLTALFIPKLEITSIAGPVLMVLCLALLNAKIWDAALFFKLPDSVTLRALMLFIANGVIFWVAVKLLPGIEVKGFFPALIAPLVFTIVNLLLNEFAKEIDWVKVWDASMNWLNDAKTALGSENVTSPKEMP